MTLIDPSLPNLESPTDPKKYLCCRLMPSALISPKKISQDLLSSRSRELLATPTQSRISRLSTPSQNKVCMILLRGAYWKADLKFQEVCKRISSQPFLRNISADFCRFEETFVYLPVLLNSNSCQELHSKTLAKVCWGLPWPIKSNSTEYFHQRDRPTRESIPTNSNSQRWVKASERKGISWGKGEKVCIFCSGQQQFG